MNKDGLWSRVTATIIVGIGWLVFLILFLAFYAGNYSFWQNIAIFLASTLIAGGFIAAMWAAWALRH